MISLEPIAHVRNPRREVEDDFWGGLVSEIALVDAMPADCIAGLEQFSHAEIVFHFHLVEEHKIVIGARHPRNNPDWPAVGIFAQRGKNRPNRIGLATVRILARTERALIVRDLDAIDGTPILDIKPVMREFLPIGEVHQPQWADELMRDYWRSHSERPRQS
jgi:tRNA-Thr(GGU) m(6)t(6)A37 methyltransferase TsaA